MNVMKAIGILWCGIGMLGIARHVGRIATAMDSPCACECRHR